MGNIGSGSGSSYPGTLDTQTAVEVDSPAAGKTKARAAVPNDLAAAVLAVETTLGTDPQGTKADVKTYLQTQHQADGTHSALGVVSATSISVPTITSVTSIDGTTISGVSNTPAANSIPIYGANKDLLDRNSVAMFGLSGEQSATANGSSPKDATVDLGTVIAGDRILVCGSATWSGGTTANHTVALLATAGSATVVWNHDLSSIISAATPYAAGSSSCFGIVKVTVGGTLTIGARWTGDGTVNPVEVYVLFLKKQ